MTGGPRFLTGNDLGAGRCASGALEGLALESLFSGMGDVIAGRSSFM